MMQQQVLPQIETNEDKEVSYSRIILVEPKNMQDPLPVWIPTVLHFSSEKKASILGVNPRLAEYSEVFKSNGIDFIQIKNLSKSTYSSLLDQLKNCICFLDCANLLLSVDKSFINKLELISRSRQVIFVVCLDTANLENYPDHQSVDLLRSIASIRLIFREIKAASNGLPQFHLETISTSVRSRRVTKKSNVISTRNLQKFDIVKNVDAKKVNLVDADLVEPERQVGEDINAALFKLPFNLSLTDAEEASRRNVVLPHSKIVGQHHLPVQEIDVFGHLKKEGKDEDFDSEEERERIRYEKMKNELDPDDDLDI